jgi:hypothetical protein
MVICFHPAFDLHVTGTWPALGLLDDERESCSGEQSLACVGDVQKHLTSARRFVTPDEPVVVA